MKTNKELIVEEANRRYCTAYYSYILMNSYIASKMISINDNHHVTLEVEVRKKCVLKLNDIVEQITLLWRDQIIQDENVNMFFVNIINSRKFPYKRQLLHLGVQPSYDTIIIQCLSSKILCN